MVIYPRALQSQFPNVEFFNEAGEAKEGYEILEALTIERNFLREGSKPDTKRMGKVVLDEFRASKIMAARVKNTENIEILFNTETDEVLGDGQVVTGVRVFNNKTNEKHDIPATGFFVAIGHKPNTDIFKGYLDLDETGYIINVPGTSKTNVEGVFVSGDAADHVYRQAVTAAGTGCMAALDAERWLAAKDSTFEVSTSNYN